MVARSDFWGYPFLLTGLLAWLAGRRHPGWRWGQRIGAALLASPLAMFADVGHAMAHTVSARMAGAPMDEIFLSSGMPRTLYANNAFPPRVHIQRSLGGLVFSLIGFTLSLLARSASPKGSLNRDLADVSLLGHSFILLGSATPLPIVDGGIILKWKLVEGGKTPAQAEETVETVSVGLGAGVLALGALVIAAGRKKWIGGLLAAGGAAAVAAGKGRLR